MRNTSLGRKTLQLALCLTLITFAQTPTTFANPPHRGKLLSVDVNRDFSDTYKKLSKLIGAEKTFTFEVFLDTDMGTCFLLRNTKGDKLILGIADDNQSQAIEVQLADPEDYELLNHLFSTLTETEAHKNSISQTMGGQTIIFRYREGNSDRLRKTHEPHSAFCRSIERVGENLIYWSLEEEGARIKEHRYSEIIRESERLIAQLILEKTTIPH